MKEGSSQEQKKGDRGVLARINSPRDLRELSNEELGQLAEEVRAEIIEVVSRNGGHLASSLGVVEATIALHRVFDTPRDKIVWDVGHQAYAHKILTGRRDTFKTLRQLGGLSGFPKREESEYDTFNTGHSSTSISAALGMAYARDCQQQDYKVIAFLGDGSLTGGMAFEALNNAGDAKTDLIVVLNHNEMSISPSVGALSGYLSRIISSTVYNRAKTDVEEIVRKIPRLGSRLHRVGKRLEETVKSLIVPGAFFEHLGFRYIGPIEGHNIELLINTLENIRHLRGPILFHIVTTKGKGYKPAERDPAFYHGAKPFDVATGKINGENHVRRPGQPEQTYTEAFAETLIDLARDDDRIVAMTAAMAPGTGLTKFAEAFPDRFHDVGIAEQHATSFAAGMASQGMRPVVAVYSTFLQRAYDQIIHDVCLQKLPVVFAVDRAGLVGEDGPTHHGLYDIAYLRSAPNMTLAAPRDTEELKRLLGWAVGYDGPVAVRYPRGRPEGTIPPTSPAGEIERGKGEILVEGGDIAVLAVGSMVWPALQAADKMRQGGIGATVADARFVRPLDLELIHTLCAKCDTLVTIEEHVFEGGFGSAVIESLEREGLLGSITVHRIALPEDYVEQGPRSKLLELCGLDSLGVETRLRAILGQPVAIKPV